jgi:type IV conjugative transfer system coupling protein TraD
MTLQKGSSDNYTRGAQLWAHRIRMLVQGLRNSSLFGLATVFCWLCYRINEYMTFAAFYYFLIERYVQFKLIMGEIFWGKTFIGITFYSLEQKQFIFRPALEFVHKFWYVLSYGERVEFFRKWFLSQGIIEMLLVFCLGFTFSVLFFMQKGRRILGTKKIRGGDFVSAGELAGILYRKKMASVFKIGKLPLVKDTETQHILITGTTGSGKTNMLNAFLPQIRYQEQRAIVFDVTGDFVKRYFNPETDVLLNPFEAQTAHWLPWNDCHVDFEYDALAAAFIDGEGFSDKYWEEAAQKVLSEAFQKEQDSKSLSSLLHLIAKAPFNEFCTHFADTFAAGLVSKEAEKGTASVRSTLLNKIERLKYLKDHGNFSIKEWVNNRQGWLFITAPPNQRDTLRPLVSAWIDIAIKGLMERPTDHGNQKMWFILDELPALQKIPSLKRGLAEGRKYGACFVAGIQNISQLEEIYGRAGASSLLDMFNSRFFFAVNDQQIAEYASKSLGMQEVQETKESLSYGSNTMRDGVNINSQDRTMPLVTPDQIKNLAPRHCFVKLPQGFPVTKLEIRLQVPSRLSRTLVWLCRMISMVSLPQNTKTEQPAVSLAEPEALPAEGQEPVMPPEQVVVPGSTMSSQQVLASLKKINQGNYQ